MHLHCIHRYLEIESIQGVSDCKVNTDTYMWVFCEWNASQLTKHPLHANSSALAAYIGVNYRIPEWTFWTWKFYKCFSKPGGKFYFWKKCWIPRVSWFYFAFQEISSKNFFFKIFLTDRKISSPIHLVYWWGNFSISQKNFEKKIFCLECPET